MAEGGPLYEPPESDFDGFNENSDAASVMQRMRRLEENV